MRFKWTLWGMGLWGALWAGCATAPGAISGLGSPDKGAIRYPGDARPNEREVLLGKLLFFDPRLSFNQTQSCASCHRPELSFSDSLPFSRGARGNALKRHTPHLLNLAWNTHFFWDGRAQSLEEQALEVISSHEEMNLPLDELVVRLKRVEYYRGAFNAAYPRRGLTAANIARALAAFQRTLVSDKSPFDRYISGDEKALDPPARRGLALFTGKANCIKCHKGANFTDGEFHNTGVISDDMGRQGLDRMGLKREFDAKPYHFLAVFGAFKTPSLRNVAQTAPYMHNGSEPTLADVVRFYNQGGKNPDKSRLAREIRPLNLNAGEMDDLVAFLAALTSTIDMPPPDLP